MPTALDTEMREVATNIIAEFGANVTLYPPMGTSIDFGTGLPVGSDSAGAVVKASPPLPMDEKFVAEREGVTMVDKLFYFDAVSVEGASILPEVQGSVLHDGERRPILASQSLWSGEQIAAYMVAVKG